MTRGAKTVDGGRLGHAAFLVRHREHNRHGAEV